MIVPKPAARAPRSGAPSCGVFSRLKISARSSSAAPPADRHAAHQREIDVAIRRARAPDCATPMPMRELRRDRERRRVEPVSRRPLVGRQRRIADEIRPLHAEAGERVEVRRLRDRDRHARLQRRRAPRRSSRWRARRPRRAAAGRGPRPPADPTRPTRRRRAGCRRSSSRARAPRLKLSATGIVRDRSGQNRRVEHRRGIVHQLRARVGDRVRQAARRAAAAGRARVPGSASCRRCCGTG